MPQAEARRHRVDINGRFLTQRVTGVQRHERKTSRCLEELLASNGGAGIEWRLLVPRGTQVPAMRFVQVQTIGWLQRHLWEQLGLPMHTAGRLLFSFGFTGLLLKRRQVITVRDAAVVRQPAQLNHLFRIWYTHLVRRVGQRAPAVMAVSEFSKCEAAQCFGVDPERLHQTTEGWLHLQTLQADEIVLDAPGLRGKRFVLAVSSLTPNKNFGFIARALNKMGAHAPHCVVVGAADAAVFAGSHESCGNLHRVGYGSDAQLKALYGAATCFGFPSFYKSFGLPPLEAMPAGLPVVATQVGGIPEAVEHAHTGLLVDSEDGEQHARAILSVNKAELHKMGQEARRRFNRLFCVERVVEELDDVYARVLQQPERQSALRPEERP